MGFFSCFENEAKKLKKNMKKSILPQVYSEVEAHLKEKEADLTKMLFNRVSKSINATNDLHQSGNAEAIETKNAPSILQSTSLSTAIAPEQQTSDEYTKVINSKIVPMLSDIKNNIDNKKQQELLCNLVTNLHNSVNGLQ